MKIFSLATVTTLAALPLAHSWALAPGFVKKAASVAAASAIIASSPLASNAVVDFSGSYSDPNHPNCQRVVTVNGISTLTIKGTDGNPGCPVGGAGKEWALDGKLDGNSILVDFSPKGGPKNLKGVWAGDGIRWPDGNKWSLLKEDATF
jgi:hypothetical protein